MKKEKKKNMNKKIRSNYFLKASQKTRLFALILLPGPLAEEILLFPNK